MKIDYYNMFDMSEMIKRIYNKEYEEIEYVFDIIDVDLLVENFERAFIEENNRLVSAFPIGKIGSYTRNGNSIGSDAGLISFTLKEDNKKEFIAYASLSFIYFNERSIEIYNYDIGENSNDGILCMFSKNRYELDEVAYSDIYGLNRNMDNIMDYINGNYIVPDDQDIYQMFLDDDLCDNYFLHMKSPNEVLYFNKIVDELEDEASNIINFKNNIKEVHCLDVLLRTIKEYNKDVVANNDYPKILSKNE